jgi:hypothetical protein
MERGQFSRVNSLFTGEIALTQAEFALFFEGADLEKRFIESPQELKKSVKIKQELAPLAV